MQPPSFACTHGQRQAVQVAAGQLKHCQDIALAHAPLPSMRLNWKRVWSTSQLLKVEGMDQVGWVSAAAAMLAAACWSW